MKKIITAFVFCFLCGECFSQAGEWVWIKGDSVPNQPGSYGVQGVPSPSNNPPSLYEPCEWTDLNGNFWLFGGTDNNLNYYEDLWKYNYLSNEWIWMKGTGIVNDPGNYGIQGIPSISNNPPALAFGSASWVDNQGNLWLFGGTKNAFPENRNSLWRYNISTNEWTWMKGSNIYQAGIYGLKGIPDPANTPGARSECGATWTDNSGHLWLFGGMDNSDFNDLWKYNIASNEWTWMNGSQLQGASGIYGAFGIEDTFNTPGARWAYSHWKDILGNLWLFAGKDWILDEELNDLWRYNPVNNFWVWMGGDSTTNGIGMYGTKCISLTTNLPGSRFENRASWTDQHGNFWFFGGYLESSYSRFNDLWMYCFATNEWIWISGDSISNPIGSWGGIGISNPFNKPSGRMGSVGWTEGNGHLFLFGGSAFPFPIYYNDLWKYTIDTTCGVCPAPNSIEENNYTNELLVFPNPTNSSLTISFSSSEKQSIELRIYNTLGQLQLFQSFKTFGKLSGGKFEKEINVKDFSAGIYFIRLIEKDGIAVKKFVKD